MGSALHLSSWLQDAYRRDQRTLCRWPPEMRAYVEPVHSMVYADVKLTDFFS